MTQLIILAHRLLLAAHLAAIPAYERGYSHGWEDGASETHAVMTEEGACFDAHHWRLP